MHIVWTSCTCKHAFFFLSSPYTTLINTKQHNTIYTSPSNLAVKAFRSICNRKASNRAPAVLQDPSLPTEIPRSTVLRYAQTATHNPPPPALTWGTWAQGPFALSRLSRLLWRAVAFVLWKCLFSLRTVWATVTVVFIQVLHFPKYFYI